MIKIKIVDKIKAKRLVQISSFLIFMVGLFREARNSLQVRCYALPFHDKPILSVVVLEVEVGVKPYSVYFVAYFVGVHISEKGVPVSMLIVRNFGDIPF